MNRVLSAIPVEVCLGAVMLVMPLAGLRAADTAEIRLLSAASMQTVFHEIIGDFERASGHKVIIRYRTMGAITEQVLGGEEGIDLIISSPQSIARLSKEGRVDPASVSTLARTGVGIVVPAGDPMPRVASAEDFGRVLLAAKTIVYANPAGGGAAGIHIARLIEKLGLAEALKPKTKLAAGGDVTEVALASGPGAVGLTQVSEIVGKPEAQYVVMPEELQNYTGFTLATPAGGAPADATAALIAFVKGPAAAETMKRKGMRVD